MKESIDCFLIGHNQIAFDRYEQTMRKMGTGSCAYRDLDINTLSSNRRILSAADVFNLFCSSENGEAACSSIQPIRPVESFSAGIAYLGTYLHRRGFSFDYINSFQEQKEELAAKLEQENILTIAVVTTLYVTPLPVFEIVEFVRTYNKTAKIIIGGPFVSTKIRTLTPVDLDCLFKAVDADIYVNSSQGEETLVNIIRSLKNNNSVDRLNNIYYKNGDTYAAGPVVKENNQLARNMVNWDLFSRRAGQFVNVRTSISCPFSCAFCGFPEHAGAYQTAGVEEIEQELNRLAPMESLKSIAFVDDTFNIPRERFKDILRMMIRNRYKFKWSSFFRCQFADAETVELMKESGCEGVLLGMESGSDPILKNMNKAAAVEDYLRGIALLKEYGILTLGNFVVGFPGETEKTIRETIDFIKTAGLDLYRAQLWYCEPISPIYREKEKYDITGESFEWSHKTMDSKTACDIIEQLIVSVDSPVRYPQYYFDYDNVVQLTHKGLTPEQVMQFLAAFNNGIKEKIKDPSRGEVSFDIIKQIKESCGDTSSTSPGLNFGVEEVDVAEAEFDF